MKMNIGINELHTNYIQPYEELTTRDYVFVPPIYPWIYHNGPFREPPTRLWVYLRFRSGFKAEIELQSTK